MNETGRPRERRDHAVGPHVIAVEGDMITSHMRGPFTAEETAAYFRILEDLVAEEKNYFILVDMGPVTTLLPETRRAAAEFGKRYPAAGIVVWGNSSFAVRVLFKLMVSVIRFFQKDAPEAVFVESEMEARAWVAEQRAKAGR